MKIFLCKRLIYKVIYGELLTLTLTKFVLGQFPHLGGKDATLEASLIL